MGLKNTFANNLKRIRKRNKLTQEQFAELVNVAPRHISFLETGRSFPSCELMERICNILHADISEFFKASEKLSREELLKKLEYTTNSLNNEQLNYLVKMAEELY